jgi:hypothetical protein
MEDPIVKSIHRLVGRSASIFVQTRLPLAIRMLKLGAEVPIPGDSAVGPYAGAAQLVAERLGEVEEEALGRRSSSSMLRSRSQSSLLNAPQRP